MYVFQPRSPSTSATVPHSNGMCPFELGKPDDASVIVAMPFVVWLRPVIRQDRVGEHRAVVWKFVYVRPLSAIRLMFGVSIRPPNGSIARKPTSSRTMKRTFGASSGGTGCLYGSQSGTESRTSTLTTPLNGLPTEEPSSSCGQSRLGVAAHAP